jgi:hypothetical protein
LTVRSWVCSQCGHTCYEQGQAKLIEAARTADGRSPVDEFLSKLARSAVRNTRAGQADRKRLADVAIRFEDFARTGQLKVPTELRWNLRDGISEIKAGDVRLLFYERSLADHGGDVVRLTNGFIKGTDRTPRGDLDKALWVREEDQQ